MTSEQIDILSPDITTSEANAIWWGREIEWHLIGLNTVLHHFKPYFVSQLRDESFFCLFLMKQNINPSIFCWFIFICSSFRWTKETAWMWSHILLYGANSKWSFQERMRRGSITSGSRGQGWLERFHWWYMESLNPWEHRSCSGNSSE